MRIAIGIDSVLADIIPPLLDRLNPKYGLNLQPSDITRWDFPINGKNIGFYIRSALSEPAFVLNLPEIKGAREVLTKLYSKNTLIIATRRPNWTRKSTLAWLDGRFLYHGIVFSAEKTIRNLNCELIIDDSLGYMERFLASGGRGILINRPWNQGNIDLKRCFRASNWEDVPELIQYLEP